jgi:hypothetical protein
VRVIYHAMDATARVREDARGYECDVKMESDEDDDTKGSHRRYDPVHRQLDHCVNTGCNNTFDMPCGHETSVDR